MRNLIIPTVCIQLWLPPHITYNIHSNRKSNDHHDDRTPIEKSVDGEPYMTSREILPQQTSANGARHDNDKAQKHENSMRHPELTDVWRRIAQAIGTSIVGCGCRRG